LKEKEEEKKYYNKNLDIVRKVLKNEHEKDMKKLFNEEEKKSLSKILTNQEINVFELRYEASAHAKIANERKLITDKKIMLNQINELEEQLKYMTINLKENEQKTKVLGFQINDLKTDTSNQESQLYEQNMTVDILKSAIERKRTGK